MKVIDFRLRPPYKEFINDWFYGAGVLGNVASVGMGSPSAMSRSMDLMFQEMDEAGVDMGVVIGRFAFGEFMGVDTYVPGIPNSTVSELVSMYPDRFVGLASLDLNNINDYSGIYEEIDKYVINGNLSGVVMDSGYRTPAISHDDKLLYPIYEYCQKNDVLVNLGSGLIYDSLETGDPKSIDRIAKDFPKLRIIVGHGGYPYVTESCWIALKRANVYLSPDGYALQNSPGWRDYIAGANGSIAHKMIFATAYPFANFKVAVDYAKSVLSEATYDMYMGGNAMRLLGLSE